MTRVLVLGGNGFIGRHAVRWLREAGAQVTVGSRVPRAVSEGEPIQVRYVLHELTAAADWTDAAHSFDVVLNCVGILRQRVRETYDTVHHLAPEAIAAACARSGTRFVHVSALGLSAQARSRFITSKVRGETALVAANPNAIIARLSLLDGEGGFGASWLRGVARLPVFIVPTSARGRIAALTADDAGQALAALCLEPALDWIPEDRAVELGGEATYTFEGYIRGLRRRSTTDIAWCLRAPGVLARLFAHLCDLAHFSPFSFGHWELLCHDNVPRDTDLSRLLSRAPTPVITASPETL